MDLPKAVVDLYPGGGSIQAKRLDDVQGSLLLASGAEVKSLATVVVTRAAPPVAATASDGWSKKQRGRLKKLSKRARQIQVEQALSGLASISDWEELSFLHEQQQQQQQQQPETAPPVSPSEVHTEGLNSLSITPALLWRKTPQGQRPTQVPGLDHRHLLHLLLQHQATKASPGTRKRKLHATSADNTEEEEETSRPKTITEQDVWSQRTSIPAWITLHNPVMVDRVVVVELVASLSRTIETTATTSSASLLLDWSQHIHDLAQGARRHVLWTPTDWYASTNHYSSLSQVLMYRPQPKHFSSTTGTSPINTLEDLYQAMLPLLVTQQQWQANSYPMIMPSLSSKQAESAHHFSNGSGAKSPDSFTLTEAQALVAAYQVELRELASERGSSPPFPLPPYVATSSVGPPIEAPRPEPMISGRIFALDCEMVQTRAGFELVRITLLQVTHWPGEEAPPCLVWDTWVRPKHAVTNFLTEYSGMTPALLATVQVELEQVQAALLSTIGSDDLVIGHSLENDFKAARWIHPRVVDTALLFQPAHGRHKFSLRHLAARLLQKQIQQVDVSHCSEEDAMAALELVIRRVTEGPSFGIWDKSAAINQLHTMASQPEAGPVICVGPVDWLRDHVTVAPNAIHALSCDSVHDTNSKAVMAWLTGRHRRASVIWSHWRIPSDAHQSQALQSWVEGLINKLPSQTILLIALQQNSQSISKLASERQARKSPKATIRWNDKEEEEWIRIVESSRSGHALWISSRDHVSLN